MSTPELNALYEKIVHHPFLASCTRFDNCGILRIRVVTHNVTPGFAVDLLGGVLQDVSATDQTFDRSAVVGYFALPDAAKVLEALDACYVAWRMSKDALT